MLFSEERFPDDISYGAIGGPEFSTDIISAHNGYEQRNVNWSTARIRYNVSHGVKNHQQLATLIAFFRSHKGKAYGFRFKDWTDYQIINQVIGIGDGHKTRYPLIKSYGEHNDRFINKPVKNTIKVLFGRKEVKNYHLDYTTGIVTFNTPPQKDVKITVTGEFDIPARFDTDNLDISIDHADIYSWNNIPIVEIKFP